MKAKNLDSASSFKITPSYEDIKQIYDIDSIPIGIKIFIFLNISIN